MMTEAELWHMMLLASENTFDGLASVATIIFAYLAAAYFVRAKLSRFQAALALGLLIPACVYFMYQVRKNARAVDASD